eukprot:2335102-Amphidinium_carterae.1
MVGCGGAAETTAIQTKACRWHMRETMDERPDVFRFVSRETIPLAGMSDIHFRGTYDQKAEFKQELGKMLEQFGAQLPVSEGGVHNEKWSSSRIFLSNLR